MRKARNGVRNIRNRNYNDNCFGPYVTAPFSKISPSPQVFRGGITGRELHVCGGRPIRLLLLISNLNWDTQVGHDVDIHKLTIHDNRHRHEQPNIDSINTNPNKDGMPNQGQNLSCR